jgi:hypothetical protein
MTVAEVVRHDEDDIGLLRDGGPSAASERDRRRQKGEPATEGERHGA